MKKNYVSAITELITTGMPVETVIHNVQLVMKRRGHEALYPKVLRGVSTKLAILEENTVPKVTVAKKEDATTDKVQAALAKFDSDLITSKMIVDPTIIGGAIINHKHRQLDLSYKSKLHKLYQSVIT